MWSPSKHSSDNDSGPEGVGGITPVYWRVGSLNYKLQKESSGKRAQIRGVSVPARLERYQLVFFLIFSIVFNPANKKYSFKSLCIVF